MTADASTAAASDPGRFTLYVAAKVRGQMAERGLKQSDLAPVLHVSQQGVSKRINGRVPFDVNEVAIIAAWLGLTLGQLLGEAVNYPPPNSPEYSGHTRRYPSLRVLKGGLSAAATRLVPVAPRRRHLKVAS